MTAPVDVEELLLDISTAFDYTHRGEHWPAPKESISDRIRALAAELDEAYAQFRVAANQCLDETHRADKAEAENAALRRRIYELENSTAK